MLQCPKPELLLLKVGSNLKIFIGKVAALESYESRFKGSYQPSEFLWHNGTETCHWSETLSYVLVPVATILVSVATISTLIWIMLLSFFCWKPQERLLYWGCWSYCRHLFHHHDIPITIIMITIITTTISITSSPTGLYWGCCWAPFWLLVSVPAAILLPTPWKRTQVRTLSMIVYHRRRHFHHQWCWYWYASMVHHGTSSS